MKSIVKKVPAQSFKSNTPTKQSYRVIGTIDINGSGTAHPLADVDPFIFLDETCMRGDEAWPFPRHPHAGLIAMTYLLAGELKPWDNMQGKNPQTNKAGGFYYIHSGHGILHEEEPVVTGGPLRWLQLWMNPGITAESPVTTATQLIHADAIPVHETPEGSVRVIVGSAFEKTSPVTSDWPIQYLHVVIKPGQTMELPIADKTYHGFIYILAGQCKAGSNGMMAVQRDCLVLGTEEAGAVVVENTDDKLPLELVLISGKAQNKPFYKLLFGGGAVIAESAAAARKIEQRYKTSADKFGKEVK